MESLHQDPKDPSFVQNPYPIYDAARAKGDLVWWADYDMPAAFGHEIVHALLRDRRFGRAIPGRRPVAPSHLAAFEAVERHSMLDAEPLRHTRLRGLVLRAFTSRRIAGLRQGIEATCHRLIDAFPSKRFDLLPAYCNLVPALAIAQLLGVPANRTPDLLAWSHSMVAMYQARRDRSVEDAANSAAAAFSAFLLEHIEQKRGKPVDDLLSELIAAEETGDRLSTDELIGTTILLLNAGHEATVTSLGLGVKTLLEHGLHDLGQDPAATVEELIRHDPPLHIFTRYAYDEAEIAGHRFQPGDQVALVLGGACRDPAHWPDPHLFDPTRMARPHTAFGGGLHFCVGAPLARLEMQVALKILFQRCPRLRLAARPIFADTYHFHGLTALMVET